MAKDSTDTEPAATGAATELVVGLIWFGATMYATHTAVTGNAENLSGALGDAVAALPNVLATMLVVAASIGAAAGRRARSWRGRLGVGLVLGTVVGAATAAGLRYGYGGGTALMVLAVAAGVVGGALAVLPGDVLKAGLWGTTWVFFAGVIFGVTQPNLVTLLGDGELASARFALGQSAVTGLIAALSTLRFLRVEGRRVLWYPVGGAMPGLVLLAAEWLTRAGASRVAELVRGAGLDPSAVIGAAEPARQRHALIVVVVGGSVALLVGAVKSLVSRPRRTHTYTPARATADAFRESLTRIGLGAAQRYGFVLAGGYAVQAAGFLKRPTEDIDLFTVWERRSDFEAGARAIADAYRAAGFSVETERRHDSFISLTVSDGVNTTKVDVGIDARTNDPVRMPIGLVLHPDDVVANKTRALYERAHASDFIDVDAIVQSGRYELPTLLRLAARSDITFDGSVLADALAKAEVVPDEDFARYGLVGEELTDLRRRFAQWRAALLDTSRPTRT